MKLSHLIALCLVGFVMWVLLIKGTDWLIGLF